MRFLRSLPLKLLFILLFGLTLSLPLLLLGWFTLKSYQNREFILHHLVNENQMAKSLEIENFYKANFLPTYFKVVNRYSRELYPLWNNRTLTEYPQDSEKRIAAQYDEIQKFYYQHFLRPLGILIPDSLNSEQSSIMEAKAMIRMQLIEYMYRYECMDLIDTASLHVKFDSETVINSEPTLFYPQIKQQIAIGANLIHLLHEQARQGLKGTKLIEVGQLIRKQQEALYHLILQSRMLSSAQFSQNRRKLMKVLGLRNTSQNLLFTPVNQITAKRKGLSTEHFQILLRKVFRPLKTVNWQISGLDSSLLNRLDPAKTNEAVSFINTVLKIDPLQEPYPEQTKIEKLASSVLELTRHHNNQIAALQMIREILIAEDKIDSAENRQKKEEARKALNYLLAYNAEALIDPIHQKRLTSAAQTILLKLATKHVPILSAEWEALSHAISVYTYHDKPWIDEIQRLEERKKFDDDQMFSVFRMGARTSILPMYRVADQMYGAVGKTETTTDELMRRLAKTICEENPKWFELIKSLQASKITTDLLIQKFSAFLVQDRVFQLSYQSINLVLPRKETLEEIISQRARQFPDHLTESIRLLNQKDFKEKDLRYRLFWLVFKDEEWEELKDEKEISMAQKDELSRWRKAFLQKDTCWDAINIITTRAFPIYALDKLIFNDNLSFAIKSFFGVDLKELLAGNFLNFKAGELSVSGVFNVIPSDFPFKHYQAGVFPPPKGLSVSLIDQALLADFFARIININPNLKTTPKDFIQKELAEILNSPFFKNQHGKYTQYDFSIFDKELEDLLVNTINLKKNRPSSYQFNEVLEDLWELLKIFVLNQTKENAQRMLKINQIWKKSTEIYCLDNNALIQHMIEIKGLKPKSKLISSIEEWKNKKSVTPFSFEYMYKNQTCLGLLVRSEALGGFTFFLSLNKAIAGREINLLVGVLIAFTLLAILIAVFLCQAMIRLVVAPILALTNKVEAYALNHQIGVEPSLRADEIGQMDRDFHSLAHNVEHRITEMGAMNEFNEKLIAGTDLDSLMNLAVSRLGALYGAEFALLAFFEQTSREKIIARGFYNPGQMKEETLLRHMERLKPLFLEAKESSRHIDGQDAQMYRFKNLQVYQIESEADSQTYISGVLVFGDLPLVSEHQAEDRERFRKSFCKQTVTVIAKAWLDKIKKDNIEGRDVQLGLMPQSAPDTYGQLDISFSFVAAKFLGGDFFDFVHFKDKPVFGCVISDVSGKGIGPALFGSTCKSMLKLLARDPEQTGQSIQELNDWLCLRKENSLFASLFYLTINLDNLKMVYSSAGHNKMFLVRAREKKIIYLSAKGLPLGMFSPGRYETRQEQLETGDWLFLYTDGITELENHNLALFGMDRTEKFVLDNAHLSANAFKELLLKEMDEWRDGVDPSDDITFIAIKIESDSTQRRSR